MQWYYSKNNSQLGPVEQAELAAKLTSGEVATSDLIWREGMLDWVPAGQVAEFRNLAAPAYPSAPARGQMSASPYAPPAAGYGGGDISTYLWQAIVVTLLCCQPLGLPAVVYAAKANAFKECGDLERARTASDSARTWCWAAFGVGLAFYLLFFLMGAGGIVNSSTYR